MDAEKLLLLERAAKDLMVSALASENVSRGVALFQALPWQRDFLYYIY